MPPAAQFVRAETVLRSVSWQVGRHGKLLPIGEFDMVTLDGIEVRRAPLNNLTWITEMGLKLNSRIVVARNGDSAPTVVEVLG